MTCMLFRSFFAYQPQVFRRKPKFMKSEDHALTIWEMFPHISIKAIDEWRNHDFFGKFRNRFHFFLLLFVLLNVGKLMTGSNIRVVQNRAFLSVVVNLHEFRSQETLFRWTIMKIEVFWCKRCGLQDKSFVIVWGASK